MAFHLLLSVFGPEVVMSAMKIKTPGFLKKRPAHPLLWMWTGVFVPGLLWLGHLTLSFTLAAYACRENQWPMHFLSAAAALAITAILLMTYKSYLFFQQRYGESQDDGDKTKSFLCLLALLLGILLVITIIVSDLSNVLVEPCL